MTFKKAEVILHNQCDDVVLLARIKAGEQAAFEILLRRYVSRFYRVAYRFVGQKSLAEDIVQEAFLKLWEKPNSWREELGTPFTVWFYRVVLNLCLDFKKKPKAEILSEHEILIDDAVNQEEYLLKREREKILELHIQALPCRQQMALNLCFYEGVGNQVAAEIMGINAKALQSLLMRAKKTLKGKLSADLLI